MVYDKEVFKKLFREARDLLDESKTEFRIRYTVDDILKIIAFLLGKQ